MFDIFFECSLQTVLKVLKSEPSVLIISCFARSLVICNLCLVILLTLISMVQSPRRTNRLWLRRRPDDCISMPMGLNSFLVPYVCFLHQKGLCTTFHPREMMTQCLPLITINQTNTKGALLLLGSFSIVGNIYDLFMAMHMGNLDRKQGWPRFQVEFRNVVNNRKKWEEDKE